MISLCTPLYHHHNNNAFLVIIISGNNTKDFLRNNEKPSVHSSREGATRKRWIFDARWKRQILGQCRDFFEHSNNTPKRCCLTYYTREKTATRWRDYEYDLRKLRRYSYGIFMTFCLLIMLRRMGPESYYDGFCCCCPHQLYQV